MEDFSRLNLTIQIDLKILKTKWLQMLDQAEQFIKNSPVSEAGCIYYNIKTKKFVTPPVNSRNKEVVPHFGKLLGIWSSIAD